jgi:spore maturation protein CgeB
MKIVIFGLAVSSSWGNGHATLWRGLCKALSRRGHRVVFLERDVPYYASHRDLTVLPEGGELVLYPEWSDALLHARRHLADAEVAIVTSYCPDGAAASNLVLDSRASLRIFYDLDAPVTLANVQAGKVVDYLPPRGLGDFDLVLSYTGGRSLEELQTVLGAKHVAPLYGCVDPDVHRPTEPGERYRGDLGYLGTCSEDRAPALRELFVEPARRLPDHRFVLGGSMYGNDFPWQPNIYFYSHLPPADHAAFYCSTSLTLNVTRRAMAESGYCPSARLFEATACQTAVLSDYWPGLEHFFKPGEEILVAGTANDTVAAMETSPETRARIARAGRERSLAQHTAAIRAAEFERILDSARQRPGERARVGSI